MEKVHQERSAPAAAGHGGSGHRSSRIPGAKNPFPHGVEKLSGAEHAYRIRLGDYRVVYEVVTELKLVEIQRVRHRKDVYRM